MAEPVTTSLGRRDWLFVTVTLTLLGVVIYLAVTLLPGRASTRRENERLRQQLDDEAARRARDRSRVEPLPPPPRRP